MRYVCSAAATIAAILWTASGAAAQNLSITNYRLVSEERVTRTASYFTYRADLVNNGPSRDALTATVSSRVPSVQVVPGQTNLHFAGIPANTQVPSLDSFTILVDRSVPFDFSQLQWSFVAPVARAGPPQTTVVGGTVTLNGTGSTNPSGVGQLTYQWSIVSRPPGSVNNIVNPGSPVATFVVDAVGHFGVLLTVSNGAGSDSASMTIATRNSAPVANAGPNQTAALNSVVKLNGSASSDVDGDVLSYSWQLISVPPSSAAALSGATTVSPSFVADRPGTYIAQLTVNDGLLSSTPATVNITTGNTPPMATPGPPQLVNIGTLVQLNGAGSTDVDGDPLTYKWTLITLPPGSAAVLNNRTIVNPTFTADRAGTYVAQLVVNDGKIDSAASTVSITTQAPLAPTANAGPDQTVKRGTTATLNGSGTDPQNLPLTFSWSLTTLPPGSSAVLANPNTARPLFQADVRGTYVAQLIVNNGYLNSAPDTVSISTENSKPVANAGVTQSVPSGSTVLLSGTASSDPDGDPITYSWSFLSRPPGSNAALNNSTTPTPSFLADVAGTYIAQLIVHDGLTASDPATVSIAANQMTLTPAPYPLNMFTNAPGTLTINISPAAPAGGLVLRVAILDPTVISAPQEVSAPAGATGVNIPITPLTAGNTTITVSAPGYRLAVGEVSVSVPSITLTLAVPVVGLSRSTTGTVQLSGAAPPGGVTVLLSAAPPGRVTLQPASVTIPAGGTTGSFQLTGTTAGAAIISAAATGYTGGSADISVQSLGAITVQSGLTLAPGQSAPIVVSLVSAAPAGGVEITLSSSSASIATIAPATITIPQGSILPATQPTVTGVGFGTATISASAAGFGSGSETVQVRGALTFSPAAPIVGAGGIHNLTLSLSGTAPSGGVPITLSSTNPAVGTVPATVTIPQGQTSVVVPLNALAAGQTTIGASTGIPNVTAGSANATVVVFGDIVLPSIPAVGIGQSVAFPVTLSENAPGGGVTVTLTAGDPSKVSISPGAVVIPAGARTPAQPPQITGIAPGTSSVSASAPGFGSATTIVQVNGAISLSPATFGLSAGATQTLQVSVSGPAPAGGLVIALQSNNTAVVTAPPSVTIGPGNTTASFVVTAVGPGSTTVRGTHSGLTEGVATVTVQLNGAIGLPADMTIRPGQTVPLPVTLPSAAPASGVIVSLQSSDTAAVTLSTSSVSIAPGQTTPATQPTMTGGAFGSSTITASAANFTTSTRTMRVGAALSFPAGPLNLLQGSSQNVTLSLSATAPAGGLLVSLSSNNPAISVPASVTIPAGAATATVLVQGLAAGSGTITASTTAPNVTGATLTVNAQNVGAITGPATLTVPLGQTAPLPVQLPTQAPAGGVTLTLTSSATSIATVTPATVGVPAAQTQPAQTIQVRGVTPGTSTVTVAANGYTPLTVAVQVTASISFASPGTLELSNRETRNLVLQLSGPAPPSGLTVDVASLSPSIATVPATVVFAGGATSVNVPVTGVAPGSTTVRASGQNLAQVTAAVTVVQSIDLVLPQNLSVAPGEFVQFPVSLARPAVDTTRIDLQISDSTKARLNFTTLFVNPGQTTPTITPRLDGLAPGTVTVTASSSGLNSATTNVTVGYTLTFTPTSVQVAKGSTRQTGLVLSGGAPATGLEVALSSDNPAVATVPAIGSFQPTTSSIFVRVTGVGVGTTIIRASGPGIPQVTLNVTVTEPASMSVPATTQAALHGSTPLALTLSTPAPAGGADITLSSSDTSIFTISPAIVTVPAGMTSPSVTPVITGTNVGNATVTATALDYSTVTGQVVVGANVTFVQQNVAFEAGTSRLIQLQLSTSAPIGGLSVNLVSSNPSVVRVPATIDFFPDGSNPSTVAFSITGVAPGTAQIRASGINIPEATTNVRISGPLEITTTALPSGVVNVPYQDGGGIVATGGVEPYTFSLVTGTLPANLALNPNTGRITGTPTAEVTGAQLTFSVTDSSNPQQSRSRTLGLTITAPVAASIAATGGGGQSTKINSAFAARLQATVRDSGGNPVPGAVVTFAAPASGPSATFSGGNTATTNASGVALSNPLTANAVVGSYTVSATVAGAATPVTFSLTNTVGTPASVTATGGATQSARINTAFGSRLQATVRDEGGNPVSGVVVTFTAPASGASATFSGANTATTDASGVALSNPLTANSIVGSYTVAATFAGAANPANYSLTNTAADPAAVSANSGTPQSATINSAFENPLVARVVDAGGNPVQGVTVTFTGPATGAGVTFPGGNTGVTSSAGLASVLVTANSIAGQEYIVNARVAGVVAPAVFRLTNIVGEVSTLSITDGNPQSAPINTPFAKRLVVSARDSGNNPVVGATVTFTVPATGASGTFAGNINTAVTNASGIATSAVFTANSSTGTYTITASASGKTATFNLTNTVGPAASMTPVAGTTPQSATILQPFGSALAVTVRDAGGNPVPGVNVTFTAPATGASGTFASASTVQTNASGIATAPAFTANGTRGSYSVVASAGALTADFTLTNNAGTPFSLTASGGGGQSAPTGTAFGERLLVTVADQGGNLLAGVTVTFVPPDTGASGSFSGGNTAVTNASGVATSPLFTANNIAGTYQVLGRVSSLTPASFTLTNAAGPAASITPRPSTTPQSTTVNSPFAVALAVIVSDAQGNPIPNRAVTFTAPTGQVRGTFSGGSATATANTNSQGIATAPTFTAGTSAGSYVVTAAVAGLTTVANFSLTNTARPAAAISATSGGSQITLVGTGFANTLVATVVDQFQNPVQNASVTFTAPPLTGASAIFNGSATVLTNQAGVATSPTLTANQFAGVYNITASVPGVQTPALFSLTNSAPQLPLLQVGNATVGMGLQVPITVRLPEAATAITEVTITSTDPSKVLLTVGAAQAGQATATLSFAPGDIVGTVFVQALDKTSTVAVEATATGYNKGTGTITLAPSGIVLGGPNGINVSFQVPQGNTATVTVFTARVDTSGNFVETQAVRGGANGVAVSLLTDPAGIGSVLPATVTIQPNDISTTTTFRGLAAGGTTIRASSPNFTQGALSATVTPPALIMPTGLTVGRNLQTYAQISLAGQAQTGGLPIQVTSSDPAKVLLTTNPNVQGTASITVTVLAGQDRTPEFYIQALSETGPVQLNATSAIGSGTSSITLARSGFVLAGPFGPGASFFTTSGAANTDLGVSSVVLSASLGIADYQPVRGGFSASVNVTSSNMAVGRITTSPVVLGSNTGAVGTQFDPVGAGSSTISISTPANFTTPALATTLTATVATAGIQVSPNAPIIGRNLQQQVSILLGQTAPAGGLTLTVSSPSSGLLFGRTASESGSNPLTITVPASSSNATVFINALNEGGTASYSISAAGYNTRSDTVEFTPSGVILFGESGTGWPLTTTMAAGTKPVIVQAGLLDPGSGLFMWSQPVRGGISFNVPLGNSNPGVGTVPAQAVITTGTSQAIVNFVPLAVGQTVVSVSNQPPGSAVPSMFTTLVAQVNP